MKILLSFLFCSLLFNAFSATAQNEPSPEAEAFYNKAMAEINAKHVRWIKTTATEVNEKKLSPDDVKNKAQAYGVLGSLNGMDIEAIAFLVLMQASKSAQEDLKAIMAQVKALHEQKAKQRELLSKMQQQKPMTAALLDSFHLLSNRTIALQQGRNPESIKLVRSPRAKQVSKADLDAMAVKLKSDLDSMSEMGEMESLRLQMLMDQKSKMISTLSNLLKKMHDTQQSIIQNLK